MKHKESSSPNWGQIQKRLSWWEHFKILEERMQLQQDQQIEAGENRMNFLGICCPQQENGQLEKQSDSLAI